MKDAKAIVHVAILVVVYLFANCSVFDEKINLNGDNIYYHILGEALATGQGYVDISNPMTPVHNHYPPGYPFIISIFMRLGFEEISFFNGLNGLFGCLSLLVFYAYLNKTGIDRKLSFVICLFLGLNGYFLNYAVINMSEVPYIFFSVCTMYLLASVDYSKRFYTDPAVWLLLVCLAAGYYIRTAGIALVVSVLFFLSFRKKWLHLIGIAGGFAVAIAPWYIRGKRLGGNSYMSQLMMKDPYSPEKGRMGIHDFTERLYENFSRYLTKEIPELLRGDKIMPDKANVTTIYWIAGGIILALIFFALWKLRKEQMVVGMYVVLSAGVVLLWPSVWKGVRFIVPLLPVLIFLVVYGVNEVLTLLLKRYGVSWNAYVLCAGCIFMVAPIKRQVAAAEASYPVQFQYYFDLATWTRDYLPDTSVVCCRKPELFYYFSGRKCTNYKYTTNDKELLDGMEKMSVDYVVIDRFQYGTTENYLVPAILKNGNRFQVIRKTLKPEVFLLRFKK